MKTALEWFNDLPEGVRELAIKNFEIYKICEKNKTFDSLAKAISDGFDWSATPEGPCFWSRKYDDAFCKDQGYKAKRGELLAEVLGLKKNKDGRYNTAWGDKTALGLYLTAKRIIEEGK